MKSLFNILKFEYLTCVKNKSFIITTLLIIGGILLFSAVPSIIMGLTMEESPDEITGEKTVIAIRSDFYRPELIQSEFSKYYPASEIKVTDDNQETLEEKVDNDNYIFAIIINDPLSYTYITKTNSIMSEETNLLNTVIKSIFTITSLEHYGLSQEEVNQIFDAPVNYKTITTGKDITKNYWPSYLLMCVLFVAITSYSQLVAQSVVSEKNTRAMELLITCAKPKDLIFGKVIGSGLAGLTQLGIILLFSVGSFGVVSGNMMPSDISEYLSINPSTALYALLFFILGYFMYSFLMGALASFASKSEDLNNLASPVVLLLTGVYMVSIFMTISENFDNLAMIIMSYFPLTAPIAMFIRATLSEVAIWEILISVAVQVVTIYFIGILASQIYKIGVLMYGNPPKFKEIFKMLKLQKEEEKRLKNKT